MNRIINSIGAVFFLAAITLACSCAKTQPFAPEHRDNPWADDYTDVSAMTELKKWGVYNVHDPAIRKFGEYYYAYSTDAIYNFNAKDAKIYGPIGHIQVRKSKDLVEWEFLGWALSDIPKEATDWVRSNNGGDGATNIWAPYPVEHNGVFRLYYSVSAFGRKTSYIGLAESTSPEGPWVQKGCVVKTSDSTPMNAIDPTVVTNPITGEMWMHYGSYFGGLYCVQLDPETGLTINPDDMGHLVARRANYRKDNLEAPEIYYHADLKKYFLFVSYEPLFTTYDVRVGRADSPEGPFLDYYGNDMRDTTNNVPILIAPYKFRNQAGWAGTAHCGVFDDGQGNCYMAHQGRLAPANQMMVMHIRQMFFTADGWPVVSPERYCGDAAAEFTRSDIAGEWEIAHIVPPRTDRGLEAGQILWGEGLLRDGEVATSKLFTFTKNGKISDEAAIAGSWSFQNGKLQVELNGQRTTDIFVFAGQDWENQTKTILFTGMDNNGCSLWGKRVK